MADVELFGLEELKRNMLQFQKEFNVNVMARALRKGANIIRDDAKRRVPYDIEDDGVHIRDDIKVRRDPNPQTQGMNEIMYIRPYPQKKKSINKRRKKEGKKAVSKSTYYWHIVEFKQGARFMTKAWEYNKNKVLGVIISELKKGVAKQVAKLK